MNLSGKLGARRNCCTSKTCSTTLVIFCLSMIGFSSVDFYILLFYIAFFHTYYFIYLYILLCEVFCTCSISYRNCTVVETIGYKTILTYYDVSIVTILNIITYFLNSLRCPQTMKGNFTNIPNRITQLIITRTQNVPLANQ